MKNKTSGIASCKSRVMKLSGMLSSPHNTVCLENCIMQTPKHTYPFQPTCPCFFLPTFWLVLPYTFSSWLLLLRLPVPVFRQETKWRQLFSLWCTSRRGRVAWGGPGTYFLYSFVLTSFIPHLLATVSALRRMRPDSISDVALYL